MRCWRTVSRSAAPRPCSNAEELLRGLLHFDAPTLPCPTRPLLDDAVRPYGLADAAGPLPNHAGVTVYVLPLLTQATDCDAHFPVSSYRAHPAELATVADNRQRCVMLIQLFTRHTRHSAVQRTASIRATEDNHRVKSGYHRRAGVVTARCETREWPVPVPPCFGGTGLT